MKPYLSTRHYFSIAIALLILGLSASLIGLILAQSPKRKPLAGEEQSVTLKNPCWFRVPEGIEKTKEGSRAYKEYSNRQRYGYPEDIPIDKAVKIFNDEAFCAGPDKERPFLSKDELLSAIADEILQGVQGPVAPSKRINFPERTKALKEIWLKKVLPKGSLIIGIKGYSTFDEDNPESGSYEVDCWNIYLYLNMNKNPDETFMEPEQICLIRKQGLEIRHVSAGRSRRQ